jgi:hypothetical protein
MYARRNLLLLALAVALTVVSSVLGCGEPKKVDTMEWDHAGELGTSVTLWGQLILSESLEAWEEGFVWDTESHVDWQDYANHVWADQYEAINRFSVDIEGLDRFTVYHYRAYGKDTATGTITSVGADRTFVPGGPRVDTLPASNRNPTSADLNGELLHMGGAESADVRFEYGTNWASPDMEAGHQTLTQIGGFTATVTGMESCTKYHFRAVAANDADTHTGRTFPVTPGEPAVETRWAAGVGPDTATLQGAISDLAGMPSASVWFEYGDASPDHLDRSTPPQSMEGPGDFSAGIGGLKPRTTYWYRAVADNGVCEARQAAVLSFTTPL